MELAPSPVRLPERDAGEPLESARLRWINAGLERIWARKRLTRPRLEPDALVAAAERTAGLSPPLDATARERLDLLCDDLARFAELTPLGLTLAYGQLVAALANRARAQAILRREPEIAALPLPAPVIVVGQMRSGSTRMQRLLACDPRLDHNRFFESWNPVPRFAVGWIDDRKARAWLALKFAQALNPGFAAIHPTSVAAPDEEIGLFSLSLFGPAFEAQWRVPRFTAHCESMDTRAVYEEFALYLRLLRWLRRCSGRRSLVLKVPQFAQDLDSLLAVFPDARLVRTRRDPAAVVASSASLALNQMQLQSDAVTPEAVGREWLRKTALRERRLEAALAGASAPRATVRYVGFERDWREQVGKVYAMLGMPLTAEAELAMSGYLARSWRGTAKAHQYSLAGLGLDAEQVRAAVTPTPRAPAPRPRPCAPPRCTG
jgi:hypothetical protein